ncbi:MAG: hypothetical protein U0361_06195 [Nitrospiraceae bacterium]
MSVAEPSAISTPRQTLFESSRTLPGQLYMRKASGFLGEPQHALLVVRGRLPEKYRRQQHDIAPTLTQGQRVDRATAGLVIEILAEKRPCSIDSFRSPFVAAMIRTSSSIRRCPAAFKSALLQKAQQLDLQSHRQLSDFIQEQRASLSLIELPRLFDRQAPGTPRSMPNSSASSRFSGMALQSMATKGLPPGGYGHESHEP